MFVNVLSNHVQIDHTSDVNGVVLVRLSQVLCSEEALLFSRESCENDRGLRLVLCEDTRKLKRYSNTRCILIVVSMVSMCLMANLFVNICLHQQLPAHHLGSQWDCYSSNRSGRR